MPFEVDQQTKMPTGPRFALGLAATGISLGLTHWSDTLNYRLMVDKRPLLAKNFDYSYKNFKHIVFQQAANGSYWQRWRSLNSGLVPALKWKMGQRFFRNATLPALQGIFYGYYDLTPTQSAASAALIVSVTESSVLLPIEILKVKAQLYPSQYAGLRVWQMFRRYSVAECFRSLAVSNLKAATSFVTFFAGREKGQEYFECRGYSPEQARLFGATAAIIASTIFEAPLDVVRARMLAEEYGAKSTAREVAVKLVKHEGLSSLGRAVWTKIPTNVLRLGICYTLLNVFSGFYERHTTHAMRP